MLDPHLAAAVSAVRCPSHLPAQCVRWKWVMQNGCSTLRKNFRARPGYREGEMAEQSKYHLLVWWLA